MLESREYTQAGKIVELHSGEEIGRAAAPTQRGLRTLLTPRSAVVEGRSLRPAGRVSSEIKRRLLMN